MWSGRKKLAISSALAIASATGYCVSDEQRRRKAELTALSAYRIGNLLSTVTTICADYGFQHYVRREVKTSLLEQKEEELLVVQHNMEVYSTDLLNIPEGVRMQRSPVEEEALRTKIAATRVHMDNLAREISELLDAGVRKNHDIHTRNAIRLTNMCAENGGLYIKLGQHIAMLDYIVPSEYRAELTRLLGSTPNSSIESVRRVIRSELGDYPEKLFDSFDPVPIASASLAQVHVAYKDGKKYAVKVQHEGLKESATVDTWVITNIVALVHRLFEEFDYVWLTNEMNRNLPLELNFQFEKLNIHKAADVLKDYIRRGEVVVPTVNEALTQQRVLTMSFEEGCYITNKRQISEWVLSRTQIGSTIAHVFCDLIFRHGFVHCDPHEANMLVRPNPANPKQTQVVLLDHGLYRELDNNFRRDYCRLWQGIALGNAVQIEQHCRNMHAGGLYTLLAAMITQRPWDDIVSDDMSRLKGGKTKAADSVMLQAYTQKYLTRIVQLLGRVPSDLLLLFKTNDCLRHVDGLLGSNVNSSAVAAQVVAEVILKEDLDAVSQASQASWLGAWGAVVTAYSYYYSVVARVVGYYAWAYWQSWWK